LSGRQEAFSSSAPSGTSRAGIDNQLRGRSGRQGDPGETRFYLSMQDDIMRLFGSERIMNMMETLGIDEDTPIDAKILSGAIENAQKTVEGRNFQSRKNVLEYDDVMNVQRKIIYEQRRQVLDGEDLQKNIQSMMRFYVDTYVASAFGEQPKLADKQHFFEMMTHFEPIFFPTGTWLLSDEELAALTREQAEEKILSLMQRAYAKREEQFTSPVMREIERVVTLRVVDEFWMDHIDAMDDLRQGIRLRAYAQTDPVIEYKREGFDMFEAMNDAIKEEIVRRVFLVRIKTNEEIKRQRRGKGHRRGRGRRQDRQASARRQEDQGRPERPVPVRQRKKIQKNAAATRISPPNAARTRIKPMFHTIHHGSLEYLTADALSGSVHCFSTRFGGVSEGALSSLNLGTHRGDRPENVRENYRILGTAVGFSPEETIFTRQEHTDLLLARRQAGLRHRAGAGADRRLRRASDRRTRRGARLLRRGLHDAAAV